MYICVLLVYTQTDEKKLTKYWNENYDKRERVRERIWREWGEARSDGCWWVSIWLTKVQWEKDKLKERKFKRTINKQESKQMRCDTLPWHGMVWYGMACYGQSHHQYGIGRPRCGETNAMTARTVYSGLLLLLSRSSSVGVFCSIHTGTLSTGCCSPDEWYEYSNSIEPQLSWFYHIEPSGCDFSFYAISLAIIFDVIFITTCIPHFFLFIISFVHHKVLNWNDKGLKLLY